LQNKTFYLYVSRFWRVQKESLQGSFRHNYVEIVIRQKALRHIIA
jgi:hypothetical protein